MTLQFRALRANTTRVSLLGLTIKARPWLLRLSFRSSHREAIKYRFDGSSSIGPEKRKKKAIRTKNCLSEASFFRSAFF
jgi:hypothetical protein